MTYLVSQLWFCLLLAWMLGNIIGWLLRGGCSAHIKRVEKNWKSRYLKLEKEKDRYIAQVNELRLVDNETNTLTEQLAKCQKIEQLNSKLRSRLKGIEIGTKVIQSELRAKTQGLVKCKHVLMSSKKVIYAKDERLQKLASKLRIISQQLNSYKLQLSKFGFKKGKHIEELKTELNKVKQHTENYKLERDEKAQQFEGLKAELNKVKQDTENYNLERGEKEQQFEGLKAELSKVKEHAENYKLEQDKKEQQSVTVNEELTSTQFKLNGLIEQFAKIASELVSTKASFAEKEQFINELTSTVAMRDDMVECCEKKLKEQGDENKQLSGKLDVLANEFTKVASKRVDDKKVEKTGEDNHQEEVQHLVVNLKQVEEQLAQANEELTKKETTLQVEQVKKHNEKQDKTQNKSKIHRLERELKYVKKKLKAVSSGKKFDQNKNAEERNVDKTTNTSSFGIESVIENIRGIGAGHGVRLRKLGINNNHDLLQKILSSQDAQQIAQKISCKPSDILLWKKMADFLRIEGINAEFAQLLALSQVNSVEDIVSSNAMQLLDKMKAARKKERRIRHLPKLEEINQWIHYAKTLDNTDLENKMSAM